MHQGVTGRRLAWAMTAGTAPRKSIIQIGKGRSSQDRMTSSGMAQRSCVPKHDTKGAAIIAQPRFCSSAHVPEKWVPVFRKDMRNQEQLDGRATCLSLS